MNAQVCISYSRTISYQPFFFPSTPAMPTDTSTAASSPYLSRPDSATATYHDLSQVAFSQRPPQGAAGKRPHILYFPISPYCDFYQAHGHTMSALLPFPLRADQWTIPLHNIHTCHTQLTCHILLTTLQYHTRACFIRISHIHIRRRHRRHLHPIRHLANAPLLMNRRLLGARGSARMQGILQIVSLNIVGCAGSHSSHS